MSQAEARDAARRKLGNLTAIREEIYHMNTMTWLDSAWRDLEHGARLLRRNPSFALVAILSLALGVGANTAIFQLLDAVRIPTLPVKNADELVDVRIADPAGGRTGQFTGRRPSLTNADRSDVALRPSPRRSRDAGDGGRRPRPRRDAGELSARAARVAPRTDRSAARGMNRDHSARFDAWRWRTFHAPF